MQLTCALSVEQECLLAELHKLLIIYWKGMGEDVNLNNGKHSQYCTRPIAKP